MSYYVDINRKQKQVIFKLSQLSYLPGAINELAREIKITTEAYKDPNNRPNHKWKMIIDLSQIPKYCVQTVTALIRTKIKQEFKLKNS